jgi:hypothetical protein
MCQVSALGIRLVAEHAFTDYPGYQQWVVQVRSGTLSQADLQAWAGSHARGPVLAAVVVATVLWAAGVAWLVRAWNALRIACSVGPLASLVAAIVTVTLVGAVLAAAGWAAS